MNLNKRIIAVMAGVLSLFLILITHLVIFTVNPPEALEEKINGEDGLKFSEKEEMRRDVRRGDICDRNGEVLAHSEIVEKEVLDEDGNPKEDEDGNIVTTKTQVRKYPFGELYSHVVGYSREKVKNGRTNIELNFDSLLITPHKDDVYANTAEEKEELAEGARLTLTVDTDMMKKAREALYGNKGSIIVMNPKTGEIYCMYSNPTFNPDPEFVGKNWNKINEDPTRPFYSRATQSTKEPGSTFKIVTAIAALENGMGNYETEDNGFVEINGRTYKNGTNYTGTVDLEKAIEVSSNVYFAEVSQKLGNDALKAVAEKFYMCEDQTIQLDIPVNDPGIDFDSMNENGLAEASFGQGTVNVTPLHMAMVASAVANEGNLMKPYLVQKISYDNGEEEIIEPTILTEDIMSPRSASIITEGMIACIEGQNGTGRAARISGMTIAGKSGTAQNPGGADHTWFIGFAPAYDPQIAICVMRENSGGGGGSVCGSLARTMIQYCRNAGFIKE